MNEYIESCQREERTYDEEGVREAVRLFLKSIGEDPEREGLVETPDRIARACRELFAGLQASPADVLEKHFDVDTEELVLVKDIELYSVCEHHLLPFHGVAHVGYIPAKDGVMGLSKLARFFPDFRITILMTSVKSCDIVIVMIKSTRQFLRYKITASSACKIN